MKRKDNFIRVVIIGLMTFCMSSIQTKAQAIDTIFTTNLIFAMEVLEDEPGNIILSGTHTCVSKSTDFGQSWVGSSFDTVAICYDLSFNLQNTQLGFLAGLTNLFKTVDGGYNWFSTAQLTAPILVDINPYFPNIIFAQGSIDPFLGPYYLYISIDHGETWQDSLLNRWILDPQFNPENDRIAYGFNNKNILKTTDIGRSWEVILTTNPEFRFTALSVDENNPGTLYASKIGSLYKTTNDGDDWFQIDSTLRILIPSFIIRSILLDDSNPGRLFIGLDEGLFLTEDDGNHWKEIHDGRIYLMEADSEIPRNIYCTTNFERTAIRLLDTFTVTGVNEVKNLLPERFYLFQNYPNPFNPTTKIKFTIPSVRTRDRVSVQLKIYDVLGSEIATLVNEEKPAGSYEVEFSAKGGSAFGGNAYTLPSGVYFYQLRARDFVKTKKMVLLE